MPHSKRVTFVYRNYEGLGIAYVAAYARAQGHQVQLVLFPDPWSDTYVKQKDKSSPMAGRLQARVDRELLHEIADFAPDLVCFSVVTDDYQWSLDCAARIKAATGAPVVFGGVHVTSVPERAVREPAVDFVALGEGERLLVRLLDQLDDWKSGADVDIPGLWYERGGTIQGSGHGEAIQELDDLPFPAKDLFYARMPGLARTYTITTSRGCPYQCTYCYNAVMLPKYREDGKWMRQRSVDNVIAELRWAVENFHPHHVLFMDDVFATSKKWVVEFAERYRREVGLPFALVTEVVVLREEVVRCLKEAGLVNVQVGIQTLNDESKQRIDRPESKGQVEKALGYLNQYGVHYQVDHMLGIPGETDLDQRRALAFYNTYRPDIVSVFWLKYYPKLPIIDFALEKNILRPEDIEDIEEGRNEASYLFGGNAPDFEKWLGYNFLFGWLNFLPRRVIDFFLHGERIRWVAIKSFFLSSSLPRLLSTLVRRPDFRGRDHVRRTRMQLAYIARIAWRDWRRGGHRPLLPESAEAPRSAPTSTATSRAVIGRRSGGKVAAVGGH
jgi:anaerobic magnesium-protoporphyrin IX monomethyl ester cyclase